MQPKLLNVNARRKPLELTKAAFPDGKVPMPYLIVPAGQKNDLHLTFVPASIAISSYDTDDIVGGAFHNV